jgi:hypothetical protein
MKKSIVHIKLNTTKLVPKYRKLRSKRARNSVAMNKRPRMASNKHTASSSMDKAESGWSKCMAETLLIFNHPPTGKHRSSKVPLKVEHKSRFHDEVRSEERARVSTARRADDP